MDEVLKATLGDGLDRAVCEVSDAQSTSP
jgi:hypothetical protein